MERIFDSSAERVDFEQIAKALCTSVDIKFIFRFLGLKEFQRTYWPVKVGFLYIEVMIAILLLQYTENRLSLANMSAGILSALRNGK